MLPTFNHIRSRLSSVFLLSGYNTNSVIFFGMDAYWPYNIEIVIYTVDEEDKALYGNVPAHPATVTTDQAGRITDS